LISGEEALNENKTLKIKDTEIELIAELMKNSRRSDRELARAVGISQPTVSRLIKKLEKEGIIREYTMIPNFRRLGYQIMAITFFGRQETEKEKERAELRKAALEMERKTPVGNFLVANGMGLDKGRVVINLFRDYSNYSESMKAIKNLPHIDPDRTGSFLIDLNDESNFRMLSMTEISSQLSTFGKHQHTEANL
jgi:DNA-binding Lrp family transcriptional regulator